MSSLQEISRSIPSKKIKKKKKSKAKPPECIDPRAKYLAKLYCVLKSILLKHKRIAYAKPSQMVCFVHLADLLESNNITDPVGFMLAQVEYWGNDIYPSYLVSKQAVNTYWKYRERQGCEVVEDYNFQNEKAALKALCFARHENEVDTLEFLKDSGIFSEKFLENKGMV